MVSFEYLTKVVLQTFDSLQLLHDLVDRPDDWVEHVRRYTASISTTLLYGWRTPRTGTGYVKDLLEWMEVTSEALNFNLVDFYPFLKVIYDITPHWLLPSKHKLHELQKLENRVFYDLLNRAKDKLKTGQAYPSQSTHNPPQSLVFWSVTKSQDLFITG